MTDTLFITGPVILNGVPDADGDTLDSVEIKTIFTKYTNHLSDVQHDRIEYDGLHILENWINREPLTLTNGVVPAKSWMATAKVTNPEIIQNIENGKLTCFSLGSVSEDAKTSKSWFIDKRISYHDLKSIEMVTPLRISVVDRGANRFPFDKCDYLTFINKNAESSDLTMTNKEDVPIEDAKFSLKEIFGLKKFFNDDVSINKNEESESPNTDDNTGDDGGDKLEELFGKIDLIIENQSAFDERLKALENIDKSEDKDEEDETKSDDEDKEINKNEESKEKETVETKETDINKSITNKPADIVQTTVENPSFFKRTKRDNMGRKMRR